MKRRHIALFAGCLTMAVLAAACSRQKAADKGTAAASAAGEQRASKLASLLPAPNAVPGWTEKSSKLYGADSLWEFIDGGAESYLANGYQEVVASEYVNPAAAAQVLIDIFRMAEAKGALGIYSREKSPGVDVRPIGAEGYVHGTVVNFWSGPYYVKLTTFKDVPGLRTEMIKLAEAVGRNIGSQAAGK